MATDQKTVDYITEQMAAAGDIHSRKMFGEYAIYCDDRVIAFVCDDQLFIKPNEKTREFLGEIIEAPAYPGSKMYFLIDGERWDDAAFMVELARITASSVPLPKPKKTH